MAKFDVVDWLKENWQLVVVIILVFYLLTKIQVP